MDNLKNEPRPYKCQDCDHTFIYETDLQFHQRHHCKALEGKTRLEAIATFEGLENIQQVIPFKSNLYIATNKGLYKVKG